MTVPIAMPAMNDASRAKKMVRRIFRFAP